MTRQEPDMLDFYDCEVTKLISEKYGVGHMDALRRFLASETYGMLMDVSYGMAAFGAPAVFDMWEAEQVTGDPRNSAYVRGE